MPFALPSLVTTLVVHANTRAQRLASDSSCDPKTQHLSMKQLIAAFAEVPGPLADVRPVLTHFASEVVLCRLMAQAGFFETATTGADLFEVMAWHRALQSLREAGITSRACQEGRKPIRCSARFSKLLALLGAWEDALKCLGVDDQAGQRRHAVLAAATLVWPYAWSSVERVKVVSTVAHTPLTVDLLQAMAASDVVVHLHVNYPMQPLRWWAFSAAQLRLIEAKQDARYDVQFDNCTGVGAVSQVFRAFAAPSPTLAPHASVDADLDLDASQVTYVAAGDDLVETVCRRLLVWRQHDIAFSRMAVIVPEHDDGPWASGLLRDRLEAACFGANIPVASTSVRRASKSLVGRYLYRCILLGEAMQAPSPVVLAADVAWLLSMSGDAMAQGPNQEPVTQVQMAHVLSRLGRRPIDAKELLRSLVGVGPEIGASILLQPGMAPSTWDVWAQKICAHVLTFLAQMRPLVMASSWPSFLQALRARLVALNVAGEHNLQDVHDIDGFLHRCERAVAALPPCDEGTFLHDKRACLAMLLQKVLSTSKGHSPPGVMMLTPDAALGQLFDATLIVNANAGVFPGIRPDDPILDHALRGEFNAHVGPKLPQMASDDEGSSAPAHAQDTWTFLQLMQATRHHFDVIVVKAPDDDDLHPASDVVEALAQTLRPRGPQATRKAFMTSPPLSDRQACRQVAENLAQAALQQHAGGGERVAMAFEQVRKHIQDGRQIALNDGVRAVATRLCDVGLQRLMAEEPGRLVRPTAYLQSLLVRAHQSAWRCSQMDVLGACMFRFFASSALALNAHNASLHTLDAKQRGTARHRALEAVYKDLIVHGGLKNARRDAAAARQRARSAFDKAVPSFGLQILVHPALHESVVCSLWQTVLAQFDYDLKHGQSEPKAVEYRFGGSHQAPVLVVDMPQSPMATLALKGSIDRIDIADDTPVIFDYKSSMQSAPSGRHFQLGLYALVARRDFVPQARLQLSAWRILTTDDKDMQRQKQAPVFCGATQDVARALKEQLSLRVTPYLQGKIAPDSYASQLCGHCDYRALCRYPRLGDGHDLLSEV